MKNCVLFFFLFCQTISFCQTDSILQRIDSLKNVLENAQHDTTTAWAFYHLTYAYREFDGKTAIEYCDKCYDFTSSLIRQKGHNQQELNSLRQLMAKISKATAGTYNWSEDHEKCILLYEECIAYNDTIGNTSGKSECLRDLAKYFMLGGFQEKGEIYYTRAIAIEKSTGDSLGWSYSLMSRGNVYRRLGNNEKAIKDIEQSIKIKREIEDTEWAIRLLLELGIIHRSEGKYQKAMDLFYEAMQEAEQINYDEGKAFALHNIANVYNDQKNYIKASEFALKSLRLFEKLEKEYCVGMCSNQLGGIYKSQKLYPKALSYLLKAIDIMENLGRIQNSVVSKLNVCSVYTLTDSLDKAEPIYLNAIKEAEKLNSKPILAQALTGIGNLYLIKNDLDKALADAKKGYDYALDANDIKILKDAEKLLYKIYEKKGNWEAGFKHYKAYVTLNDSIVNIDTEREAMSKEAEYRIQRHRDSTALEMLVNEANINRLMQEKRLKNRTLIGVVVVSALALISILFWFRSYRKAQVIKAIELEGQIGLKMNEIDHLQTALKSHLEQRTVLKTNILEGDINQYLTTPLSKRELEVLEELTKGHNNNTIAENLFVSINTVRTHLVNIYDKLEVDNRLQAVNKASNIQNKIKSSA